MAEGVLFHGVEFAVPDRLNSRRINQLAVIGKQMAAAEKRNDTAAAGELMQDYMALVESLVVMCVRPEDRDRFDALCDEVCPSDDELMAFVGEVAAAVGGRPTQRSSDSSDGPTSTPLNSEADYSLAAVRKIYESGEHGMAYVAMQVHDARYPTSA